MTTATMTAETDTTYQGWTNRETWSAALWANNDLMLGDQFHSRLHEDEISLELLADEIRDEFQFAWDYLIKDQTVGVTWIRALREIGSLNRVNWEEIADSYSEA